MVSSRRVKKTAEAQAREMARLADLAVHRLEDTVTSLNARLMTAVQDAAKQEHVLKEARDVAAFAQEVLAVVSHDLRNPLNSIMLSAQMILMADDAPRRKQNANRIIASTLAATRLINDLLDYSQARVAGRIRIARQEANLHDLARTAVDEVEYAKRGHSIRVRADGDGVGQFDPDRILQVLLNLISNSLAHSPDDSEVDVATVGDKGVLVIRVHNANRDGPIPPDLVPVLFEPFKTGSVQSGGRARSVGLGLYIVDQIVKAHGGRVDVASTDQGTSFTVTLGRDGPLPKHRD